MRRPNLGWAFGVAISLVLLGMSPVFAATHRPPPHGGRPMSNAGCAGPTQLFCEDFETLPVGAGASSQWSADTQQGTVAVEAGHSAGRGKVLHLHTDGNGRAFLTVNNFVAPANSYFGRIMVKVDAFPTAPDWAHFTMIEATGSAAGGEIVRPFGGQYAPTNNGTFLGIGADGGPTGDWTNWRESAPAVAGTWRCVEWEMQAADNRVTLWLDGADNPDLTVSTKSHGGSTADFVLPVVSTIKIGWQLYQANPTPAAYNVLLDNIALGSTRIGCP
jgi:hypothetical protein